MKWKWLYRNGFWLLFPLLIWNLFLTGLLPDSYSREVFWKDIPFHVNLIENATRILLFILPFLIKTGYSTAMQKTGWGFYIVGLILYFSSWLMQIFHMDSTWSQSFWGFAAPAYSTFFFFIGIGLLASENWINRKFLPLLYIIFSFVFVSFHTLHTYIVFLRF